MRQQRMWMYTSMIAIAAIAIPAAGCAVEHELASEQQPTLLSTESPDQEQLRIVGGAPSRADAAVVALLNRGEQFCTGTIIAETIVLTAAHCLPPHNRISLADVTVFIGPDTSAEGIEIPIVDGMAHPMWDRDLLGYDIGLVRLAQAAPIDPVPVLTRPRDELEQDTPLRLLGYGTTKRGGRDHGVQYSGAASIAATDEFSIYVSPGPAVTCNGDSGGPALVERNGREFVAGVHSRSNCTSSAVEERVDIHFDSFIEAFSAPVAQCPPIQGCAQPCTGDACALTCERTGECARPDSAYRPSNDGGGCRVAHSSGGNAFAFACALAVLMLRRRSA